MGNQIKFILKSTIIIRIVFKQKTQAQPKKIQIQILLINKGIKFKIKILRNLMINKQFKNNLMMLKFRKIYN